MVFIDPRAEGRAHALRSPNKSLCATSGSPCNGAPRLSHRAPRLRLASCRPAPARRSATSVTIAFTLGFTRSICARCACMISTALALRERINERSSRAERKQTSAIVYSSYRLDSDMNPLTPRGWDPPSGESRGIAPIVNRRTSRVHSESPCSTAEVAIPQCAATRRCATSCSAPAQVLNPEEEFCPSTSENAAFWLLIYCWSSMLGHDSLGSILMSDYFPSFIQVHLRCR